MRVDDDNIKFPYLFKKAIVALSLQYFKNKCVTEIEASISLTFNSDETEYFSFKEKLDETTASEACPLNTDLEFRKLLDDIDCMASASSVAEAVINHKVKYDNNCGETINMEPNLPVACKDSNDPTDFLMSKSGLPKEVKMQSILKKNTELNQCTTKAEHEFSNLQPHIEIEHSYTDPHSKPNEVLKQSTGITTRQKRFEVVQSLYSPKRPRVEPLILTGEENSGNHVMAENIQVKKMCKNASSSVHDIDELIMRAASEGTSYRCPDCSKQLYTKIGFINHMSKEHGYSFVEATKSINKNYLCNLCESRFVTKVGVQLHQQKFHAGSEGGWSLVVNQDDECLPNSSLYIIKPTDIAAKIPRNCYKCIACNVTFSCRAVLRAHKFKYHGQQRCYLCQKDFHGYSALTEHAKACHPGENVSKQFICEFCSRGFMHEGRLMDHVQSKHQGKVHQCEVCGKELGSLVTLKAHLKIHNSDKYRTCDICGQQFCRLSQLEGHMRAWHPNKVLDEDKFICQQCDKSFSRADGLKRHQECTHENKTFVCDICKKVLTAERYLKTHKRKHHRDGSVQ